MTPVLDRFLKYVSFDTESAPGADCFPSTAKQKVFAQYLVEELKGIGIADAAMDEFGYVTGTLQSNVDFDVPVFGFISHMDTSPDMPGNNIKPQVIKNYDGGDIVLNKELGIVLSPKNFPKMLMYQGKDLITTDGTTLLGADNKAGITAIVGMVEYLLEHPEVRHGTIKIGFTPDEEVGSLQCGKIRRPVCLYGGRRHHWKLGVRQFQRFFRKGTYQRPECASWFGQGENGQRGAGCHGVSGNAAGI